MIVPAPLFAASLVFLAAAAGSSDYDLVTIPPAPEPICAKSFETCNQAIQAVIKFGLFRDLAITEMYCMPARTGCFPEESNFIDGYNMPPRLRR